MVAAAVKEGKARVNFAITDTFPQSEHSFVSILHHFPSFYQGSRNIVSNNIMVL